MTDNQQPTKDPQKATDNGQPTKDEEQDEEQYARLLAAKQRARRRREQ
jgi:hypothetical protein